MNPTSNQGAPSEFQFAMALLAHAARNDNAAICASLRHLAEPSTRLCSVRVIAALLGEFERGISGNDRERLAQWFTAQALSLAADAANRGERKAS